MSADLPRTRTSWRIGAPLLGLAVLAGLTGLTVLLAILLLNPSGRDVDKLLLFLPCSGGISLGLALGFTSLSRGSRLRRLRGKLLAAVFLSAALMLINVSFTGYLMFLSAHDLKLLAVLLCFSLGMSAFLAMLVAESMDTTLRTLSGGVRLMGDGKLDTRIDVRSGDELEDLAQAFNRMAGQLEESFGHQRDLEQARRHLIGAVSHDLRTPLATMRAMVESINDGVVTDADTIQRYHHTMQTEIAYLSRLIDDLFELSQIDSGLLQLRPEPGSVSDLVSDALEALMPQAEQRQLNLQGQLTGMLPMVVMDVPRMQRVLYNLVQNALRHTPPDGSIVISAIDAGPEIEISVADTGEGVDAEDLPRLFERFYRGNRARSREEAGSGLGLTIAKGIVELHGGRIWAQSQRGSGATFVFTIPKASPEPVLAQKALS